VKAMAEMATAMASVAEIVIVMAAATVATTALPFPSSPF
jgi:hypothetical protein